MANHPSLILKPDTGALEILTFARAAQQTSVFSETRNLRAIEKTIVSKNGTRQKVTVLFVRAGRESPLEWLVNAWNRKEQRLLAAQIVYRAVPQIPVADPRFAFQSILGTMRFMGRSAPRGAPLPMRLTVASTQLLLGPRASDPIEQKRALRKLRDHVAGRQSPRSTIGRGLLRLGTSHERAHWLLRLPRFLWGKTGKNDKAQNDMLVAYRPVDVLIKLLLEKSPAAIAQMDNQHLQGLISGVHNFAAQWRHGCDRNPSLHRQLVSNFPELAAIDWLLASFGAICPSMSDGKA